MLYTFSNCSLHILWQYMKEDMCSPLSISGFPVYCSTTGFTHVEKVLCVGCFSPLQHCYCLFYFIWAVVQVFHHCFIPKDDADNIFIVYACTCSAKGKDLQKKGIHDIVIVNITLRRSIVLHNSSTSLRASKITYS